MHIDERHSHGLATDMNSISNSNNHELSKHNHKIGNVVDNFFGNLDYQIDSPELSAEARKYAELLMLNELIYGSAMVEGEDF